MDTLLDLVSSGITSTAMSCLLALVALLLFIGDVIVALLAFFCVLLIVFVVLGVTAMAGEALGIIESVVLAILVGMSVDYVVHVGVAFIRAQGASTRVERMGMALEEVGQPVLSGALTTLITASALFLPTLVYFGTFGRMLCFITCFSSFTALTYFPMLLMYFGPMHKACQFSLASALARCCNRREAPSSTPDMPPMAMEMASTSSTAEEAVEAGRSGASAAATPASTGPAKTARRALLLTTLMAAILALIYGGAGVTGALTLQSANAVVPAATCSAGTSLKLTFAPYEVPSRLDSYVCQPMSLPTDCAYHVTRFAPIERSTALHHMLLYGVIEEVKPNCTVGCFDMPGQVTILWAWALGVDAMDLPPNVGLRVGKGTSIELATLQMHYNNPQQASSECDSSAIFLPPWELWPLAAPAHALALCRTCSLALLAALLPCLAPSLYCCLYCCSHAPKHPRPHR